MTGNIVKAITLTTYGTAFLKDNYDISGLTLEHPSFSFSNKVEFLFFKKHFFRKPSWHQFANNPIGWFEKLKQDGCKEIRMVFQPDNSISLSGEKVPDHKLAGFVGGGGRRYLQTVFDNHSDFWQLREKVTDKNALNRKIWTDSYYRTLIGKQTQPKKHYNIIILKEILKNKLTEISAFAKKENLSFWAERFDKAIDLLDSSLSNEKEPNMQMIPSDRINLETIQLLTGASAAWCFGGMGSWNDVGFKENHKYELYDRLTADLYDIVNESYIAVANSYE
jgi:hypothetical protein